MPLTMSESSVTHEVLKHTLQKYVPNLWARVEDRGLANNSSEALETTIELAAQCLQANTSSQLTGQTSNLPTFGRDEIIAAEETDDSGDMTFPIESDFCYKCGIQGHWSRSCPYESHQNIDRPHPNNKFTPNLRGELARGISSVARKTTQNLQQNNIKLQQQRLVRIPTYQPVTRGIKKNGLRNRRKKTSRK